MTLTTGAEMPTLKPDPETDLCSCGARRPFGEHCCADCHDLEEQESFLDPERRSVYGHPDDQPCLDGIGERF